MSFTVAYLYPVLLFCLGSQSMLIVRLRYTFNSSVHIVYWCDCRLESGECSNIHADCMVATVSSSLTVVIEI